MTYIIHTSMNRATSKCCCQQPTVKRYHAGVVSQPNIFIIKPKHTLTFIHSYMCITVIIWNFSFFSFFSWSFYLFSLLFWNYLQAHGSIVWCWIVSNVMPLLRFKCVAWMQVACFLFSWLNTIFKYTEWSNMWPFEVYFRSCKDGNRRKMRLFLTLYCSIVNRILYLTVLFCTVLCCSMLKCWNEHLMAIIYLTCLPLFSFIFHTNKPLLLPLWEYFHVRITVA